MIKSTLNSVGNILTITLSNNNINTISINMLEGLYKAIDNIDYDKIRCVIFNSDQSHFCAGADLRERSGFSDEQTINFLDSLNHLYHKIEQLDILTISVINGACLGGGLELALSCDFRIGNENSIYSFPETSIGIIPGAGGTQRMTRLLGISKSMEWIFTSKRYSSDEALSDGVIDFLVNTSDIDKFVDEFVSSILKNAPIAIKAAKKSINSAFIDLGFKAEREQYLKTLKSEDRNEGLSSFKDKRDPNWKNK